MLIPKRVPPRTTVTYREEYSVADYEDITYTLDINGLRGHDITFTR
jgi:hypothetical protein